MYEEEEWKRKKIMTGTCNEKLKHIFDWSIKKMRGYEAESI